MGLSLKRNGGGDSLAIALGAQRIEFAQVHRANGSKPVVRSCATLAEEDSLLASLRGQRKHLGGAPASCVALLPPADYQLQVVEAPPVPDEEMRDAVRWRMKELLDYPVEDATVDVTYVPSGEHSPSRAKSLFAASARNSVISERMKLFRDAKMPLTVIDVPEMAQRNVATLFEDGPRAVALLCFREEDGLLTFSAGGELYLTRHMDLGYNQIVQSSVEARTPLFDRIALDVQRSLDHFDRQFSHVPLGRFLLGPMPQDVGLVSHLTQNLSMTASALALESVLELGDGPGLRSQEGQARHLHVLGAALRMQAP